jgi:hypothetical protein
MSQRYRIKTFRRRFNPDARAPAEYYPVTIGSAWTDRNGKLRLHFDALPIADDRGQVTALLDPIEDTKEESGE